jgi:alkylation response protein AidB-like acyl-CoA dehydrogenase
VNEHGAADPRDLEEYRGKARAWLVDAVVPDLPEEYEARAVALREWHRTLYAAGWVGIDWPVEFGGQGLSVDHRLVFTEELARAGAPQPVGAIGLDIVGPTLLTYGTEEQRERFVQPMLSGDEVWCQGFSEPDAGSDLASLRTRAKREGDKFVVNGQKVWTSWASDADWCAVLVRTDTEQAKHKGISYLLVDMRSPGITVRPIVQMTGDAEFSELFFEDVRVPVENILGPLNGGWKLAMDTLAHERGGYAIRRRMENEASFLALLDGLRAEGFDDDTDPRATELVGAVQIEMRAFAALTQNTARRLQRGEVPSPLDSVDKLLLANVEQKLFGTAVDLLGAHRMAPPRGALDGEEITKGYLYGRSGSVYGGSAQIQRSIIAERMLGLPRSR